MTARSRPPACRQGSRGRIRVYGTSLAAWEQFKPPSGYWRDLAADQCFDVGQGLVPTRCSQGHEVEVLEMPGKAFVVQEVDEMHLRRVLRGQTI